MRPPTPGQILAKTTHDGEFPLQALPGNRWAANGVEVQLKERGGGLEVLLTESQNPIFYLLLIWSRELKGEVLGDAWERAYGDLEWRPANAASSPWYFFNRNEGKLELNGVKTGGGSMASWMLEMERQTLKLDLRSGHRPLKLQQRQLSAAIIVRATSDTAEPSQLQGLLRNLCNSPRLAKEPVYGVNDWYYAYGKNTAAMLLEDSSRAAEWAEGLSNRPYSLIDDGWELGGADWSRAEPAYGDMPALAEGIKKRGCRPGLWMRPLLTNEKLPDSWFLKPQTLDPSLPDVLKKVEEAVYRIHHWGFEMIKHDFSTFDVCGHWGFEMKDGVANADRTFADQTRTTAEILRELYRTIHEAAGSSLVIGCNTVGHLSAGLHEIQRIGDDTSGREWARTVKMGVNSLAYRGCQQGAFYEADPDCVGITTAVSWDLTKRWLELASHSGTVLFVSAQKEALGTEQNAAMKAAFEIASKRQPLAVPLSDGLAPTKWQVDGSETTFSWS